MDLTAIEKREVEEAKKYFQYITSQLDIYASFKVPDPEKIGQHKTLLEWCNWADKRYRWGAVADDDVAKSAMGIIKGLKEWSLNLQEYSKIGFLKIMEVAESRQKLIEQLYEEISEADKMAEIDEKKIEEIMQTLNKLQEEVGKCKDVRQVYEEEFNEALRRARQRTGINEEIIEEPEINIPPEEIVVEEIPKEKARRTVKMPSEE